MRGTPQMGVFQQPANSRNVWCYREWLQAVLNTYLLILWKVTHSIKIENFGNPTGHEGQGGCPLFRPFRSGKGNQPFLSLPGYFDRC
jgi:hypothetical protein